MKVGFTGTQQGMTVHQKQALTSLLHSLGVTAFHHGDCIGADAEAHDLAREVGLYIVGHPPSDGSKRAFRSCNESRPEKPYLDRNHDIVDETDILIACPKDFYEEQRSGTWATMRYASHKWRPYTVIWPDGRMDSR